MLVLNYAQKKSLWFTNNDSTSEMQLESKPSDMQQQKRNSLSQQQNNQTNQELILENPTTCKLKNIYVLKKRMKVSQ